MSANVYVTRLIPQSGLDLLTGAGLNVEVNPDDRVLTRGELLAAVRGRDGVLCLLTDTIDDAVMEAAGPQCKGFANYAVGYNNIDVAAATRRGLPVSNTPGVLTDTTAELAWALLFAAARRIVESDYFLRDGHWEAWGPMQFLGSDLKGATLGIVGAGRIGQAMALKSVGFEMNVLYTDAVARPEFEKALGARRVDLDALLRESDYISLHVALSPETTHLIGARELALMKETAILINTSRGPVIDEAALVEALCARTIGGAALDVYEREPILAGGLTDMPNAVLVPHIGSATRRTRGAMAEMAARNLLAMLRGERAPNCVNPEVYG
ncbi:D-glycerate dehydrogenase [Candidatus Sumerlaeota bacterium]|nr:D-glycerate dehydrogenase [Candidatus Sumerlaeota bacterium]